MLGQNIIYQSDLLHQNFDELLAKQTSNDLAAQRTTKGIHKDELEFTISDYPIKKFGSQGQQKSFIISLKLAQYAYLKNQTQTKPLLLLDDIFEKLDEERSRRLVEFVSEQQGQVFITDTHHERIQKAFLPFTDRLQHVQL